MFYIIFLLSVEDLNGGYAPAIRIYDSVKIDTLIWREGPQFTGVKEGGKLLPLGRTIAELNLGGKTIELYPASGGSLSGGTTDSRSQSQAAVPTTSSSNRTESAAPTTSSSNRTQAATPATLPSNRTQAVAPATSPSNRSTEYPVANGRSRGDYPDASPSNRSTGYPVANGRSRGDYPDARDTVPKVPPEAPPRPVAHVRAN
jgi:hypothetical protein